MLVPLQSSSIMLLRIFYPCLQIRASWGESKCSGDVKVLAKQLQQLLGQVEQGQHLLVHHLQPLLDPPDFLWLRRLASLRCAFVPRCSKGPPSRSLPFEAPSFVLLDKVSDDDGEGEKKEEILISNLCQVFPKQQCQTHDWDSTALAANPLAGSNWTSASLISNLFYLISNIWNSILGRPYWEKVLVQAKPGQHLEEHMSLLISNCFYLGNFRSKDYHCCAHISFTFIYPHVSDTLVNLNPSGWSPHHHVALFSSLIFPTGDVSLAGKPAAPEMTSTAFNDLVALSASGKKSVTNALRHHWRSFKAGSWTGHIFAWSERLCQPRWMT